MNVTPRPVKVDAAGRPITEALNGHGEPIVVKPDEGGERQ